MFIAILTLLSALSISGVAIFYSVIGLATIFPGAFVPVIIMGSVLEVGKLITASWLYRHWRQCRFLLKTYLTTAVVVLSLITSMGIFGFLSKAHLEQNLQSQSLTQKIELINSKIVSQETYIKRQNAVIERAEKSLTRTTGSNTEAIELEKQNLKDVQDKFKTLLVVETNTIKNLNDRLKILDKDVSDVLTANKSFFNEEKAAATLKESQKEEREAIQTNINKAQNRIAVLKEDYTNDTAVIQKRIDKLREGSVDDKSGVNIQIEVAEDNIINAQNTIDDLIIERGPLETSMIKLEAEVGPIKYIAALVVDWGVTEKVELNEAVRWVILLIIVVFDPLAVLLLVAANQSLIRRFPVEPLPPPQEIADLEKPDDGEILLDNQPVNNTGPDRIMVFQEGALFPWLNVRDNVEYGLKIAGVSQEKRNEISNRYLDMMQLTQFATSYTYQLSTGMKQRVAIARALVMEPDVLLMDEPFAALDPQTRDLLLVEMQLIWQKTKKTIVFVTHNVAEAVMLGTRVLVFTHRPARIKKEFKIDYKRPRVSEDENLLPYQQKILAELRPEVKK